MKYSLLAAFAFVVLQGCGGGSGGSTAAPAPAAATTGELTVGVRDAAGDFERYSVAVTSLRLERGNGDVVETMPLSTRIDFAQLTEKNCLFLLAN